jgi:hypothetical protein
VIQKISAPGAGFRGVLNYALGPSKSPELVAGNMAGENARSLAREFGDARAGNEAVGKPVFHTSLSADPSDQVTPEKWRAIAEAYVERMGYGDSLWVAVRHRDTEHDHIHIIASRITHDGTRVKDRQERKQGELIVRDLEREHGLYRVLPSREAPRQAITRDELAAFERTGEVSVKGRLLEHLKIAARDRPTMGDFAGRLEAQGVGVRLNVASTGRVSGISYELDGVAFKGSYVGRAYSWQGLQDRQGIAYEAGRDLPVLQALSRGEDRPPAPAQVQPPAAPMPELEKPAAAFRQAAVVASRVELLERHNQLNSEQYEAGKVVWVANDLARTQEASLPAIQRQYQLEVVDRLERVYASPRAAFDRLHAYVEREGFARAAEAFERSPGAFGWLRGAGLGPLRNEARERALGSAPAIGSALHSLAAQSAARTAREPLLAQAAARVPSAEKRASRMSHLRAQLPGQWQLSRELHGAAQALGIAVQGLSATIVQHVARVATHFAVRIGRDMFLGRDDGLGR